MIDTNNMDIRVKAIDNKTISIDGELFYYTRFYFTPYYNFTKMFKVVFHNRGYVTDPRWFEFSSVLQLNFSQYVDPDEVFVHKWTDALAVFLSQKDKDFITKLNNRYVGVLSWGPNEAVSSRDVCSTGNLPKIIKNNNGMFYYYDKKLYDKYNEHRY